ncbi:MAG: hypothetical protein ABI680_05210 [Chthoniobacteraceae bacterium]
MPQVADIVRRIAEEAASLPPERLSAVLDFVLFERQRVAAEQSGEDSDAAWERTLADARPRPKLEAFMKATAAEGDEPMDVARL